MKKILKKTSSLRQDLKKAIHKILKPKREKRKIEKVDSLKANDLENIEDWFPHESF